MQMNLHIRFGSKLPKLCISSIIKQKALNRKKLNCLNLRSFAVTFIQYLNQENVYRKLSSLYTGPQKKAGLAFILWFQKNTLRKQQGLPHRKCGPISVSFQVTQANITPNEKTWILVQSF